MTTDGCFDRPVIRALGDCVGLVYRRRLEALLAKIMREGARLALNSELSNQIQKLCVGISIIDS